MEYISKVNSHIEDYLEDYLNLSPSPQFAILLKGKWGSGKSWFIYKYIDKKKQEKIKPLYVSLNGVNKLSDIDLKLFMSMLTRLKRQESGLFKNNKINILANDLPKLIMSFIQNKFKISLTEIEYSKLLVSNNNTSFIIFDDLERCSLEIENILGYINTFVESQDLRVIIIANEEEIEKNINLMINQ